MNIVFIRDSALMCILTCRGVMMEEGQHADGGQCIMSDGAERHTLADDMLECRDGMVPEGEDSDRGVGTELLDRDGLRAAGHGIAEEGQDASGVGAMMKEGPGEYALARAVLNCREPERVRELLAMGRNPNELMPLEQGFEHTSGGVRICKRERAAEHGQTLLAAAVYEGSDIIVEYLLSGGAYVDGLPQCKFTPLMVAIIYDRSNIVDMLIKAGANVNCVNEYNRTPLMEASRHLVEANEANGDEKKCEVIEQILRAGGIVNASDLSGFTPLMYFCKYNMRFRGGPNGLCLLLKYGADVKERDVDGNTALILAAAYANLYHFHEDTVRYILPLLEAGADVNVQNRNGMSALMVAAKYNTSDVVQLLAYRGADINAENSEGHKALNLALSEVRPASVIALMYAGCSVPNVQNLEGFGSARVKQAWELYTTIKSDLKHMCREVIRRCLLFGRCAGDLPAGVELLGLPEILKEYVVDSGRVHCRVCGGPCECDGEYLPDLDFDISF